MVMVGFGHQGEEAVLYVAYFKIICTMGVGRRDKGCALFHIRYRLAKWEMDWQMKLNVSKCHSMRVTRLHPSRHIEFNYTLHQQTLEQVQSAKYLDLTITDDLDWGQHISEITCKATARDKTQ